MPGPKLRQRPDSKKWQMYVRVNGRRVRKSLHTTDRRLASLRAKILLNESTPLPDAEITLPLFAAQYNEWVKTRKAEGTWKGEKCTLDIFAKAMPERKRLSSITVRDADIFISKIAAGVKPATANHYIRTLRSIFETAKRWGYIVENPFRQVKLLRYEPEPPKILSIDEIVAFKKVLAADYPELVQLVDFYLLTGARRNEALHLVWGDIDFKNHVLLFRNTKGKRPRSILMVPAISKLLQSRRDLEKPFSFHEDGVTRAVSASMVKAGVKDGSLHDLRRSFASHITDLGMPPMFVTAILGHEDKAVTQTHYINFFGEMIRKYMVDLSDRLGL